jgi:arylsulfatase A-like enzyme
LADSDRVGAGTAVFARAQTPRWEDRNVRAAKSSTPIGPARLGLIGLLIVPALAWIDVLLGTVVPATGRVEVKNVLAELIADTIALAGLYAIAVFVCLLLSRCSRLPLARTMMWVLCLLGAAICFHTLRHFFQDWLDTGRVSPRMLVPVIGVGLLALFGRTVAARLLSSPLRGRGRRLLLMTPGASIAVGALALFRPAPTVAAGAVKPIQPPHPHAILMLTPDTLRADALRVYRPAAPPTPALSSLAQDSVVFEQAISPAPWTLAAFASIHTGLSPDVHRVLSFTSRVPNGCPTLAERLREAGYSTAAIGYNPLLTPAYNLHRGFERYAMFPRQLNRSVGAKLLSCFLPREFGQETDTTSLTDMAIDWLQRNHHRPFFLWLHYFDPHMPYEPPAAFVPEREPPARVGARVRLDLFYKIRQGHFVPTAEEADWIRALYEAEVRLVDANIARLLKVLKDLGLYDEMLIVFTSDHGEEFWEHGGFEHGHTVYEELLHVPLFVKLPGSKSTSRISRPISTTSLAPTVLDLCGVRLDLHDFSAPSLAPLWSETPSAAVNTPIVSTGCAYYENQIALRLNNMKYIRRLLTGREELYDLTRDSHERVSLVAVRAEALAEANDCLERYDQRSRLLRERYGLSTQSKATPGEELLRRLRSLGYAD